MREQPPSQRNRDRNIKNDWSVEPARGVTGQRKLVYLRLGKYFSLFIHPGFATALANALIDAVENDETTTVTKRPESSYERRSNKPHEPAAASTRADTSPAPHQH